MKINVNYLKFAAFKSKQHLTSSTQRIDNLIISYPISAEYKQKVLFKFIEQRLKDTIIWVLLSLLSVWQVSILAQTRIPDHILKPKDLVAMSKTNGFTFKKQTLFKTDQTQYRVDANYREIVRKASILTLDLDQLNNLRRANHASITLSLPYNPTRQIELELVEVDPFRSDFKVTTDQHPQGINIEHGKHYRGVVKGEAGSIAAISLLDNEVVGVFSTPREGNFVLGKLGNSSHPQHILYKDSDLNIKSNFECHAGDNETYEFTRSELRDPPSSRALSDCVGIYYETEYDMFEEKGSVQDVVNYVAAAHNQVAVLFANEQINLNISEIFVWTTPDPYVGENTATVINEFQQYRTSFNGNLSHLLTFRGIGGGRAAVNVLCNPTYAQAVSGISNTYSDFPTVSWTIFVMAHELGHNFGSPHTHSCAWNGNNTAIDGCADPQGNCPKPGIPSDGGTIMSYCHQQSVGINFSKGFGPQPGALMRNRTEAATCLQACNNSNPDLTFFTNNPNPCTNEEITFTAAVPPSDLGDIIDASGNGNNGISMNMDMPFEDNSPYGKAVSFDGVDDFVQLPQNITTGLNQFTFEARYFHEAAVDWQRIVDLGAGTGKYFFLTPSYGGGLRPRVGIKNGGAEQILTSPDALTPGQWYHLAVVIDGNSSSNNAKLYVDGELKAEQTFTIDIADLGDLNQNWLGKSQWPHDANLIGKLDEVRIWRTARSQADIQSNKDRELTGNETGLLVYYNFNTVLAPPTFNWTFEGGTPSTSTEANPTVKYTTAGTYDVSVTITSANNTSSGTKSDYINVINCGSNVSVNFSADQTDICAGESVLLTPQINTGDETIYDHSSYRNNGRMQNFSGAIFEDRSNYGKALKFDGTDDYIEVGQITPKSYTKEVWINIPPNNGKNNNLLSGNSQHAFWVPAGYGYRVSAGHNGEWSTVQDPNPIESGWQHYAVSYDEGSRVMKLFKNGVKVDQADNIAPFSATTDQLLVGSFAGGNLFEGMLDEVRVWNQARSEEEIASNWNRELTESDPSLILYYKFNQQLPSAAYAWAVEKNGTTIFTSSEANPSFTLLDEGAYQISLIVTYEGQTYSEVKAGYINVSPCSNLEVDFLADNTDLCAGQTVQFTSSVSGIDSNDGEGAYDVSGNGNHGTMANFGEPTYEDYVGFNKALKLDGIDDFITLPTNLTTNLSAITFEAWYYLPQAEPTGVLLELTNNENPTRLNLFPNEFFTGGGNSGIVPSLWVLSQETGNVVMTLPESEALEPMKWHHLSFTIDQSTGYFKFYINGELKAEEQRNIPNNWLGSFSNHILGQGFSASYLKGNLDEVRLWYTARTQEEILANKDRELMGNEDGLLLYYNFNPGAGGNETYDWSFPGGTPSTSNEANPTVTYAAPGTYQVSLTVNAEGETASEVKEGYITVDPCRNLEVDFTADNTDPCIGETVQFTSSVSVTGSQGGEGAYDISGNENHGIMHNFNDEFYGDHENFGKSLAFDGSDDYVELPKNLTEELSAMTLETWYYLPSTENGLVDGNIIHFDNYPATSDPRSYIWLYFSTRGGIIPICWVGGEGMGTTFMTIPEPEAIAPMQWHHLSLTIDRATGYFKFYVNGELKAQEQRNIPANWFRNLRDSWLGTSGLPNSTSPLEGQLDEVRIWNTAKTQAEILANKDRELIGNEDGLLLYYNFNPGAGGNVTYDWAFPGGTPSTSTEANPIVTYSTPGTYEVSLTVSDDLGSESEIKVDYITVQACKPDWTVTETGDNHTVIIPSNASIGFDGQPITIGDYLGVFYDDNGTLKCAGKVEWTGNNLSLVTYGDDQTTTGMKEGLGLGESFKWKLWKASSAQELTLNANYASPNGFITHRGHFAIDGVSQVSQLTGTSQPPQTASQTLTLQPGWNLISSYIQADIQDMPAILQPAAAQIALIKNGKGHAYIPSMSVNEIGDWNVVDGYQVKVIGNTPIDLTLTGQQVDLATTSIFLSEGYNLFAYLIDQPQSAQTVMAPVANELEILKDARGQTYIPALGINNVGDMQPGQGYKAKMAQAVSLTYNARMANPPADMHAASLLPKHYQISRKGGNNATLILRANDVLSYGDEIGVFDASGRLVGAATYENHILAFPIWGNDPTTNDIDGLEEGASFEIRLWKEAIGTEYILDFSANVDLYTTDGVIDAELLRTTNISDLAGTNSFNLYPNPTRNNVTLSFDLNTQATVEITLFDLAGKSMLNISPQNLTTGSHKLTLKTAHLPSGLYHCRILVDGVIYNIPFSVAK